jgi:putative phosphoesterase
MPFCREKEPAFMKVGIVSDSHGQKARLQRALKILCQHKADVLVHCGDIGGCTCLDELIACGKPAYAVAGNTDLDMNELQRHAQAHGVTFGIDMVSIPVNGQATLTVTHGNQPWVLQKGLSSRVAFLCHGHTHRQRNEMVGSTHVINPGALERATVFSVALLDTESGAVEFLAVQDE